MQYQIVSEFTATLTEQHVRKLIAEGWRPIGGIGVAVNEVGLVIFSQALVKGE
ncbi:MAG: DUF1737 domain-containing protein [Pyrinomonadaceae bacterium]